MSKFAGKINKEKLAKYQADKKKIGHTPHTRTYEDMMQKVYARNRAFSRIKHIRYVG